MALTAVLAVAVGAGAQEGDASSPYFECPYINYFDNDCPQLEPQEHEVEAPPPRGGKRDEEAATRDREGEYEWPDDNPELLLPLFPKDSLAPDTPVLYRLLLARPTLENARRYVRWYSRRMRRVKEVQDLIAAAGGEFLAGGEAAGRAP